jgi:molybdate transport system permease protein
VTASLLLSLRVALAALVVVVPLGTALGWWLARGREGWTRSAVDALVVLPMVLPPSVTGFYLLVLFGRRGAIGSLLERWFGVRLVFTAAGAALAAGVVAFPLMAKGAEAAFSRVERELEEIARVHGLSPWGVFREVTLPLARSGIVVAATLATLRALGEFGATLVFAGYVPGATDTAPLEIFMALQAGDDRRARDLVLALSTLSVATTLALAWWSRRGRTP